MIPGKVTALITRHVEGRTELCVFDHAGFVQLPAGTMEVGETPTVAAMREAWEETGLPHLELVAEVATLGEFDADDRDGAEMMVATHDGCPVPAGHAVLVHERIGDSVTITSTFHDWTGTVDGACVSRDVRRHVVHLRATAPAPDEWWVLSPDGGGSQWRCRWVPLHGTEGLAPYQQRWLDAGRAHLDPGPSVSRAEQAAGATEVFDAGQGLRFVLEHHDGVRPPAGGRVGSCYGICVTAGGDVVLIAQDDGHGWDLPGGHLEPGETIEEALAREVAEEACATVEACELLLVTRDVDLDVDRTAGGERWTPLFWARVRLEDWAPQFETVDRRLVPLDDLAAELRWEIPLLLRFHQLAREAEARRS